MTRTITPQDTANAKRLKAIYNAKKKDLGLTQTKIADTLGMKQGAVAQYINGHIALNYEAAIAFAKILQTEPWNIDPSLNVLKQTGSVGEQEVAVEVVSTLSGTGKPQHPSVTIRYSGMTNHLAGYEADSDSFAPFLKQGDVAATDQSLQPEPGDDIVITFASGALAVGELIEHSAREATFKSYASGDNHTVAMDDIRHYDVIVSVKKQKKNRTRRIGANTLSIVK